MDFFSPCRIDSYSAVLFVQSNSNLQEMNVLLPLWSIKKQPTQTPSRDFDPSKYKYQISSFPQLFTIFTSCLETDTWVQTNYSNFWLESAIVDSSATKFPKKVFIPWLSNAFTLGTKGSFESFRSITVYFR